LCHFKNIFRVVFGKYLAEICSIDGLELCVGLKASCHSGKHCNVICMAQRQWSPLAVTHVVCGLGV
jgi:hypothetical protein